MHNDCTLQKIESLCNQKFPDIKDNIQELYYKLINYTNKNWNVQENSDFDIELSINKTNKELSFVYNKQLNKFIWFKHYVNTCSSGFDFEESSLIKLFRWVEA